MTTALSKPVSRTITIGETRYKTIMAVDGVRVTEHGKRRGIQVSWSSLIALIETEGREGDAPTGNGTGVPEAITKDVAREIRTATAALVRADDAFRNAGVLPPEILAEIAADPFHGPLKQEPDWFIEPLLTPKELSSILRLPLAAVRGLPITTVRIAGEERFRQSVVRAYLIEQEAASDRAVSRLQLGQTDRAASPERTHPQARRFKSYYNRD